MGIKISKDRTYTYEEIKDIFELAKTKTIREPLDEKRMDEKMKKELETFKFMMSLESLILFDTLEHNLFEKDEKEEK